MKVKTIFWSQTGSEHVILTICSPPRPREGLERIRQHVRQMRQKDQMSLTNLLQIR